MIRTPAIVYYSKTGKRDNHADEGGTHKTPRYGVNLLLCLLDIVEIQRTDVVLV